MAIEVTCLCKKSKLEFNKVELNVGACHCNTCRTWGGGPLMAVECGTAAKLSGDFISVYDSSEWAQRGFCGYCGTHLFYRLKLNQMYIVPVGLFDGQNMDFDFDYQIFVDQQPSYYCFSNETTNKTGAEVFAEFA
ncbi:MAG: GFA family protein [Candidatus Cloacimonetes bacterium]|nr:GFA family protein [Candidatus Cloacimonadota bacterium]